MRVAQQKVNEHTSIIEQIHYRLSETEDWLFVEEETIFDKKGHKDCVHVKK